MGTGACRRAVTPPRAQSVMWPLRSAGEPHRFIDRRPGTADRPRLLVRFVVRRGPRAVRPDGLPRRPPAAGRARGSRRTTMPTCIVTWVISGALEHDGPTGPARVAPGQVAVLRTGSGVTHCEWPAAPQTRFVQVWLTPVRAREPSYDVTTPELPPASWSGGRRARAGRGPLGGPARRPPDRHRSRRRRAPTSSSAAARCCAPRSPSRCTRATRSCSPTSRPRPHRRRAERAAGLVVRLAP